ncbi:uncharacterized protein LOC121367902 [Gigantopelta aegis]|uniref:uncharacterized protein LOC121367902 n=1 Tax=Gigantopelta aegis TaxID=1735272 RepID=UPI001B88B190|nr:uncharacterized protein LOC121367902 [Gigantopelta aegis]
MVYQGFLACFTLLVAVYGVTSKCVPPVGGFPNQTMEERMVRSAILLSGKHGEPTHDNKTGVVAHSFVVSCVFKSDDKPVKEMIYIEYAYPPMGCSVSELPETGSNVIVGLKRTTNGNYTFDEPSMSQTAVFDATDDILFIVKKICQLSNWTTPVDESQDMCPKNINPGFCTNYTLPSLGLKIESCSWVLFASLVVILASMLIGQTM